MRVKLSLHKNKDLYKIFRRLKDKEVIAGWIKDERYDNGVSIAKTMNLLNSGGTILGENNQLIIIPPRPFLSLAEDITADEIKSLNKKEFIYKFIEVFKKIKNKMIENIKLAMENTNEPPLSQTTINIRKATKKYRYGLEKPLIETGKAYKSIKGKITNLR